MLNPTVFSFPSADISIGTVTLLPGLPFEFAIRTTLPFGTGVGVGEGVGVGVGPGVGVGVGPGVGVGVGPGVGVGVGVGVG